MIIRFRVGLDLDSSRPSASLNLTECIVQIAIVRTMAVSIYNVAVICLVLLEVFSVQSQNSKCYDQDVRFNGDTLTVTNAK